MVALKQFFTDWMATSFNGGQLMIIGDHETGGANSTGRYVVNWGDGVIDTVDAGGSGFAFAPHTYAADGTYNVTVDDRPGDASTPVHHLKASVWSNETGDQAPPSVGDRDSLMIGGAFNDTFKAGNGNNLIDAAGGNNKITFGDGSNTVFASQGSNKIVGGDGSNFIFGGSFDNDVRLGDGSNSVTLGDGNDRVLLGNGNNSVDTGNGNDTITVGNGTNTISVTGGGDKIYLGTGQDTLIFKPEVAVAAANAVAPPPPSVPQETVFGFSSASHDIIDIGAFAAASGVSSLNYLGSAQFDGHAGEARAILTGQGDTRVQIDTDGDSRSDYNILLKGVASVSEADFVLSHFLVT